MTNPGCCGAVVDVTPVLGLQSARCGGQLPQPPVPDGPYRIDTVQSVIRWTAERNWVSQHVLTERGGKIKWGGPGTDPKETTMSLRWIAERLSMGSWTYVSNLLRAASVSRSQRSSI